MLLSSLTLDQSSLIALYQFFAAIFLGGSMLEYSENHLKKKVDNILADLEYFSRQTRNLPKQPVQNNYDIISAEFLKIQVYMAQVWFADVFLKRFKKRFNRRTYLYRYFDLGIINILLLLFYNHVFDANNLNIINHIFCVVILYLIVTEFFSFKVRNFLLSPIVFIVFLSVIFFWLRDYLKDSLFFISSIEVSHLLFMMLFIGVPIIHFIFVSFLYRIDFKKGFILEKLGYISREKDKQFNSEIRDPI